MGKPIYLDFFDGTYCGGNPGAAGARGEMTGIPTRVRPFVFLVCAAGVFCLVSGILPWRTSHSLLFASYLLLTVIASALKTVLPGSEGTVSVGFVFFLVGICNMTISETLSL